MYTVGRRAPHGPEQQKQQKPCWSTSRRNWFYHEMAQGSSWATSIVIRMTLQASPSGKHRDGTLLDLCYRLELWRSITRAKGFDPNFPLWWLSRPIQLQGSPHEWPSHVPRLECVQNIFNDFEYNYRQFEAWHARQRKDMLQLELQENQSKIFAMIKPSGKAPLQHLQETKDYKILQISDDRTQLHLE